MNDPSYLNYTTFHQFLDAVDADEANYPQQSVCDAAVAHFGMSALRTNKTGQTPLMRLAVLGMDDLALSLVKKHPKTAKAVDWQGRPVWYYLVSSEQWTPDPNSIRLYQRFLPFTPMSNGDHPLHILARDLVNIKSTASVYQHTQALMAFVDTPESLLVANNAGERPLDILQDHLHVFDPEQQEALQYVINHDQNQRLSATVEHKGAAAHSRKI